MPETITQSPTVLSRELDDGLVIYQPTTDDVTHLDHIATVIWNRLAAGPTKLELIADLVEEFDVDHATISTDVTALLAELVDAHLIVISDDPDT